MSVRDTLALTLRDLREAHARPLAPTNDFDLRVERGELRGEILAAIHRIESVLARCDEDHAKHTQAASMSLAAYDAMKGTGK